MNKLIAVLASLGFATQAFAQAPPGSAPTAEQDHQQMMDQLGIKKLRPGRVNDVHSPLNPVNYDEAKASPYPVWPDPLTKYFISWADHLIGHQASN